MKLEPDVTVANLLAAIPSSALVLRKIGIVSDANENKSLQQICADHGIPFDDFLRAMDEIDWTEESPAANGS